MKRNKKSLYGILIVLFLFLGLGYAALTTNLSINGISHVDSASWNIYWDNVQVTSESVESPTPTITNQTTVSYEVTLSQPGDFYEFTVDAVNAGTIDAMIDTITQKMNDSVITTIPNYLEYSFSYEDGQQVDRYHLLKSGETNTYHVYVGYKQDINPNDLPTSNQTYSFSIDITFVQANNLAIELVHPKSFATDSWDIIKKGIEIQTPLYKVGDTKTIFIHDDTYDYDEPYIITIFNTSTPEECNNSNYSETACGFVFEIKGQYSNVWKGMNSNYSANANAQNVGDGNIGGWPATEAREYLNGEYFEKLPSELANIIATTKVISGHGSDPRDPDNFISYDKLYLLSVVEVFGEEGVLDTLGLDQTRQLDYYKKMGVSISNTEAISSRSDWYLRTAVANYHTNFIYIKNGEMKNNFSCTHESMLFPMFRIK